MKLRISLGALVLAVAVPAFAAAQPSTASHVDPQAPCFRWPAVDMDGDGVFDRIDHCPNTKKGCVVDTYGCDTDADGDGVCDGLDRCPDTPNRTRVDEHGCPGGASAAATLPPARPAAPPPATSPPSPMESQLLETGTIRLENVYFETGSAKLLPESETTLREAGLTVEKYPYLKIEIQGHTDTRGSNRSNLRLSQGRAESVRAYLLDHFQLRRENLIAKGYGEARPETEEHNDEELLRNRRVELHVLNPEALPSRVKVEEKK